MIAGFSHPCGHTEDSCLLCHAEPDACEELEPAEREAERDAAERQGATGSGVPVTAPTAAL
jgi:hypothetical protein